MFKIDDIVKCVDSAGCFLTKGETYKIIDMDEKFIFVINDDNIRKGYYPYRFEIYSGNPMEDYDFIPLDSIEIVTVDGVDGFFVKK